jgi:phosphatidylglycerophosphatase C
MNVYDFDKTIYNGDSSVHFYLYNLKKDFMMIRYIPRQLSALIRYKRKKISKTEMKTIVYTYFESIPNMNQRVTEFWKKHEKNLQIWYLKKREEEDVIISASPTFLLEPICNKLNVRLIASIVDEKTGKNFRENCYGKEKPIRFKEHFDLSDIDEFYSDSISDEPMALHANKAFLVKKEKIKPWI